MAEDECRVSSDCTERNYECNAADYAELTLKGHKRLHKRMPTGTQKGTFQRVKGALLGTHWLSSLYQGL